MKMYSVTFSALICPGQFKVTVHYSKPDQTNAFKLYLIICPLRRRYTSGAVTAKRCGHG